MITPENIIMLVCDFYKEPIGKVLSTCQKWDYVHPRQVAMYFIKEYIPQMGLKKIGSYFPGKHVYKNHATIIFAIKSIKNALETDPKVRKEINHIDIELTKIYGINSNMVHPETEEEKFERLWNDREMALINENKYLKSQVAELKNEVNKLQGLVYILKSNKRKKKRQKLLTALKKPTTVSLPLTGNPYTNIASSNNREFHGYKEHQL